MFKKFLITDTAGKKSLTATSFLLGFLIVNIKLLLAGITIGDISMSPFSGGEYAAAIAALGGVYVLRRQSGETKKDIQ